MALPSSLYRSPPASKPHRFPRPTATPALACAGAALIGAILLPGCVFDWNSLREDGGVEVAERRDVSADVRIDVVEDHAANDVPDAGIDATLDGGVDVVEPLDVIADVVVTMDVSIDRPIAVDVGADVNDAGSPVDVHDAAPDVVVPADVPGCPSRLVINELQSGSSTSAADEFVEIYNNSDCDAPLAGWTLKYSSSGGSGPSVMWTGLAADHVTPRGFVVVAGTAFPAALPHIGTFVTSGIAATGGAVGLFSPGATTPVDSVGYGVVTVCPMCEGGMAAPAPASGQSIGRFPDGTDSNVNTADFRAMTPSSPNTMNH